MLHLGDITKISGYAAPIVDVVVGGSPCQDLSVAGKRAGLDGERSGLFMEQLRIIKEMRERDRNRRNGTNVDIRPRYMVWENVPGAFSSNKAEDFRIVLEETAKVCDKDAVIPMPDNGKWTTSGCILGDGWSIAWRVLDAQFYGVPQRRRRIALIADFGGHSAPEILFVRKSVSRDTESSQPKGKETPTDASRGTGADDSQSNIAYTMQDREGKAGGGKGALIAEELSATLRAGFAQTLFQPVMALDRASFNQGKNALYDFEVSAKGINSPLVAKGPSAVAYVDTSDGDIAGTLDASYYKGCGLRQGRERTFVVAAVDCRNCTENSDINGTLQSHMSGGSSLNLNNVVRVKYIVRRLTPLECERLQGYPDGWTDIGEWTDSKGKVHKTSDAARYKALGNSIALPPWKWVLKRLCACYERDATLASLFDGIGGFPLI
jgi:DNA (cytosine-5)-methyltransferase 1